MATNFTGLSAASTYHQLLHVDGGPTATEKAVYSGLGVATALKVGTQSVSVDNIRLDGNVISTTDTNGDLALTPNGTGTVDVTNINVISGVVPHTTVSGIGTIATQDADSVAITGGSISGVSLTGTFSELVAMDSDTFTTSNAAAGLTITDAAITADGTDESIDITITPKGNGTVDVTAINVVSGTVPYNTITGRSYAMFSDVTDQTGSASAATAVKFGTTDITGSGITVATDGSALTRITFASAGLYLVMPSLQFSNASSTTDYYVTVWLAVNGTNVPRSATKVTVPKSGDGGSNTFEISMFVDVTAGQYAQVMWMPQHADVTIEHTDAVTGPPAVPAIPSAILTAIKVA